MILPKQILLTTFILITLSACEETMPTVLSNDCGTIIAPPGAEVWDGYNLNGVNYIVVDREGLDDYIASGIREQLITSLVTDMSGLFLEIDDINLDISHWDVSNVTDMSFMFKDSELFNNYIECWDVSNVTNMTMMFNGASSFNQDLSSWSVLNVTACKEFSDSTTSWTLPKPSFTNCDPGG